MREIRRCSPHLFCPFRAKIAAVAGTQGGAALCPGLLRDGKGGREVDVATKPRDLPGRVGEQAEARRRCAQDQLHR